MSLWKDYDLEGEVLKILRGVESHDPAHHFGKPFLTAYQIAIIFNEQCPDLVNKIGKQVGGKGIGENTSLAQYFGLELSRMAKNRPEVIEGAFLSHSHLKQLEYNNGSDTVENSLGKSFDLSMFRVVE